MNLAHEISPLQEIQAFFGTVRAEIRAGVQAKSSKYNYDFNEELPLPGGHWEWEDDSKSTLVRLSLASLSTASEPIPDIPDFSR